MPNIGSMSFIRHKIFGKNKYAYEVNSYWDPKIKKPRQKVRYLGIVDGEGNICKKEHMQKEKLILDYGDIFYLQELMKSNGMIDILKKVFGESTMSLLPLIYYRICHPSAMVYAKQWYEGNVAKILFKGANLESQRISELLRDIGEEETQRKFFKEYISSISSIKGGIIIDGTSLPNQIDFSFNAWGYHDGSIDKQVRFLFVVDKDKNLPIYFRYLPGNIVDVTALSTTIEELERLGIPRSFVLADAAFFSEDNIIGLYKKKIDFLTRLPCGRKIYRKLISKGGKNIEKLENAVRYGKRALFVKHKKVKIYGKEINAYIVLDPERKGRETKNLLLELLEENSEDAEYRLLKQGTMILVSSFEIKKEDVVRYYYMRQTVETMFGFSKDDLKLIPLRIHSEATLRGYLFLLFITLIIFLMVKKSIGCKHTVEEVMLTLRNLKCKIFDKELVVQELTKQQKEIFKKSNIIVPKISGI